jgi:hypothetical protein
VFVQREDSRGLRIRIRPELVKKKRKGGFIVCVEGVEGVVTCCKRDDGVLCGRELGLKVCEFGGTCRCYSLVSLSTPSRIVTKCKIV